MKFNCDMCDYSVPFPINLTKHMKSHHNLDIGDSILGGGGGSSSSDNENESEMIAATSAGDLDDASASSDFEEDSIDEDKETGIINDDRNEFDSIEDKNEIDAGLKIKINLGALKQPSSSVA